MRSVLVLLLLASGALAGCDGFGRLDALPTLEAFSTDPARLIRNEGWLVVAVVSGGRAYRFPEKGYAVLFRDGGVGGPLVSERYLGTYTADSSGAFAARDVVQREAGNSPRDGRRADLYLRELRNATRFEIDGATLQLRAPDGDGIRFRRIQYVTE